MRAANEVSFFILVGYVNPQFFGGAPALVKRSGVLINVCVRLVGPQGEEGGPDLQLLLVENGRVRLDLFDHQARCLVGVPDVVLVLLGKVLVVCVCDNCDNVVEVYRLFEVVLVPSDPMLRGEDLLVRGGGGGVPNVRVEELRIVSAAAVQCVVFCYPSHFFLVNDERKAAGLPSVSAVFEAHRDRS